MDLTTLTDEELQVRITAARNEQDRRAWLAAIPLQVSALTTQYLAVGGAATALNEAIAAVTPAPEPEPAPTDTVATSAEPEVL